MVDAVTMYPFRPVYAIPALEGTRQTLSVTRRLSMLLTSNPRDHLKHVGRLLGRPFAFPIVSQQTKSDETSSAERSGAVEYEPR